MPSQIGWARRRVIHPLIDHGTPPIGFLISSLWFRCPLQPPGLPTRASHSKPPWFCNSWVTLARAWSQQRRHLKRESRTRRARDAEAPFGGVRRHWSRTWNLSFRMRTLRSDTLESGAGYLSALNREHLRPVRIVTGRQLSSGIAAPYTRLLCHFVRSS